MYTLVCLSSFNQITSVSMKLSDDDVFLAWTGIVIPSAAALASVLVATFSVLIARKARDIAQGSEYARVEAEANRAFFEQQQRLDTALRDIFIGVGERIASLVTFEAEMRKAGNEAVINRSGIWLAPARPSVSALVVLIAAARLEAGNQDERTMLVAAENFIINAAIPVRSDSVQDRRTIVTMQVEVETKKLQDFCKDVEAWRNSEAAGRQKILDNWANPLAS